MEETFTTPCEGTWNFEVDSEKLNVKEVRTGENDGHQWITKFCNY